MSTGLLPRKAETGGDQGPPPTPHVNSRPQFFSYISEGGQLYIQTHPTSFLGEAPGSSLLSAAPLPSPAPLCLPHPQPALLPAGLPRHEMPAVWPLALPCAPLAEVPPAPDHLL